MLNEKKKNNTRPHIGLSVNLKKLHQYAINKKLDNIQLAEKAGVGADTVNRLMLGLVRIPKVSVLNKICIALEITLIDILNEDEVEVFQQQVRKPRINLREVLKAIEVQEERINVYLNSI